MKFDFQKKFAWRNRKEPQLPLLWDKTRQCLIGNNGEHAIDKLDYVNPEPIAFDVGCFLISSYTFGKVHLTEVFAVDNGKKWQVEYTIPGNFIPRNPIETIFGKSNFTSTLVMNDSFVGYHPPDGQYFIWDGNDNTYLVNPTTLTNARYVFTCDGVNIHLTVDDDYKGYITPTETGIYAAQYADAFTSKVSAMGAWKLPDDYDGSVPVTYSDAFFFHPLQEKMGIWAGDISGNNRVGRLFSDLPSSVRSGGIGIKSYSLAYGTNLSKQISTNLVINSDFRFGTYGWYTDGGSTVGFGSCTVYSDDGSVVGSVYEGINFITNKRYRLRYNVQAGATGSFKWNGATLIGGSGDDTILEISEGWHEVDVIANGTQVDILGISSNGACRVVLEDIQLYEIAEDPCYIPAFVDQMRDIRYEELFINTEFLNDDDWVHDASCVFADGKIAISGTGYFYQYMPKNTLKLNKVYHLTIDFDGVNTGNLSLLDSGFGDIIQDLGYSGTTHTVDIICLDPDAPLVIYSNNWVGEITLLSLMCIDSVFIPDDTQDYTDIFGNELEMPRTKLHNGCDDKLIQHPDSFKLLDSVIIKIGDKRYKAGCVGSTVNGVAKYIGQSSFPTFFVSELYREIPGDQWLIKYDNQRISKNIYNGGTFPHKNGWPDYNGEPVSVEYQSNWIGPNGGDLIQRGINEFLNTPNIMNNEILKWKKLPNGKCVLVSAVEFIQGTTDNMTEDEFYQASRETGDDCGVGVLKTPVRDSNNEILYDSNGEIIFTLDDV